MSAVEERQLRSSKQFPRAALVEEEPRRWIVFAPDRCSLAVVTRNASLIAQLVLTLADEDNVFKDSILNQPDTFDLIGKDTIL